MERARYPHTMKVLLDATAIPANLGGVGRYIDDLAPELIQAGVNLAMAVQERDADHFRAKVPEARLFPVGRQIANRGMRLAWEQTGLPELINRIKPDVLHSPHYTFPAVHRIPVVVTLHDATFFSHPQAHTRLKRQFFAHAIRRAVRGADALVVPSEATREETLRYVDGDPRKFYIAYHGVDDAVFHPVDDAEKQRVAAGLGVVGRRYIGFLGTLEPRKNVPALIRGWIRAFHEDDEPPVLVLAGGKGWDKEIELALGEVPSRLKVVRPGYLPLADLAGFLAGCEILAYPSIAEGFGLPVLEAMACGACVLTTLETSLPEVGGDAVAYCGLDPAAIARELVLLDADPARRSALAKAAQERARAEQFTWTASARSHVKAYEAVAGK